MGKVKKQRKKVNRISRTQHGKKLNGQTLRSAVKWAVQGKMFSGLKIHANTTWKLTELIVLSMIWVWSDNKTLTGAFDEANLWTIRLLGRSILGTFQGLMGALVTWTKPVVPLMQRRFHELMEEWGGAHFRFRRWVPMAVDGSRVSVPRTRPNEAAFCAKNYGHGNTAKYRKPKRGKKKRSRRASKKPAPQRPQIWTTLLWHMGLKMPWGWRTGASDSSERKHFQEILEEEEFPENTLFCCDAGFVGYDLWKTMIDRGHHFLIRVGGNVDLLQELGYYSGETDGIVYLWPKQMAMAKQPPLVLRLIKIQIGKAEIVLVTNVLSNSRMTAKQAKILYKMRWGVEVQFRTLKQTFERRMLRSRTPNRALVELDWSLLGLWLIQLFAIKEQIDLGHLPERCSVGLAINVIRDTFQRSFERPDRGEDLYSRLGDAVKDRYIRKKSKQGRYQPDKGRRPSCGKPIIIQATEEHKKWLQKYLESVV
jgi:hypothetical protein